MSVNTDTLKIVCVYFSQHLYSKIPQYESKEEMISKLALFGVKLIYRVLDKIARCQSY